MKSRFSLVLSLLFFALITGCSGDYRVVSPETEALFLDVPSTFVISYDEKPDALPPIALNGHPVEGFFVAGETDAVANGENLAPFLKEGSNRLQVFPPTGHYVTFVYDTEGPEVVILSVDDSVEPLLIHGRAIDEGGVRKVTLNGVDAELDHYGLFTVSASKSDHYFFESEDKLDHQSQQLFADKALFYDPSLRVRVNQSGVDFAAGQLLGIVNELDFNAIASAANPLVDETTTGLFDETYGPDVEMTHLELEIDALGLDVQTDGKLGLSAGVASSNMVLRMRWHHGFLPPTMIDTDIDIEPVAIDAQLNLGHENDQPTLDFATFNLDVGQVHVNDVPALFSPVVDLVVTAVVNVFEGLISNAIKDKVGEALPAILEQLVLGEYGVIINGRELRMVAGLRQLTTVDNSLLISVAGGIQPQEGSLDMGVLPALGPVFTSTTTA